MQTGSFKNGEKKKVSIEDMSYQRLERRGY